MSRADSENKVFVMGRKVFGGGVAPPKKNLGGGGGSPSVLPPRSATVRHRTVP
jgi:hypothetical protein